jgi:hypothetical protein
MAPLRRKASRRMDAGSWFLMVSSAVLGRLPVLLMPGYRLRLR